jgi:hypothetical protein
MIWAGYVIIQNIDHNANENAKVKIDFFLFGCVNNFIILSSIIIID